MQRHRKAKKAKKALAKGTGLLAGKIQGTELRLPINPFPWLSFQVPSSGIGGGGYRHKAGSVKSPWPAEIKTQQGRDGRDLGLHLVMKEEARRDLI